jgi:hypothetical protein
MPPKERLFVDYYPVSGEQVNTVAGRLPDVPFTLVYLATRHPYVMVQRELKFASA